MNNKYISSFVGVLVLVSSFLFWFNTNSVTDDPVEVKKVTIEETTTTAIEETTKTAVDETVTKVTIEETTTTTELIPISKIAVSEDSESVQITSNDDEDVVIYEGPFTSFAGFEGNNQLSLDNLVSDLPVTLRQIIVEEVLVINGCHQYALSLVGRCPYGVWDSSGTDPEGEKGADWALSIWISDRAFASGEARDVLIHEAAHALSYLTKTCISPENTNFRKDAWDFFDGEEQFADALVLYFEGEYNHYRTKGPLTSEENEYLENYISACIGN